MLYDEIQMMLSTLLADSSTNYYTAVERQAAINRACITINGEAQFLRDVKTINVLPTDPFIQLPGDFSGFTTGMDWTQDGVKSALSYIPLYRQRSLNVDWLAQRGIPTSITMEGAKLYLSPWPSKPGVLTLPYIPLPNYLNEVQEPAMFGDPRFNQFGELVAYKAAWDLLLKDRDFEMADRIQATYKARMVDFKETLRKSPEAVQPFYNNIYGGA